MPGTYSPSRVGTNPPVTPTPVTPISTKPSNHFTFGKLKLNKKKGTATVKVNVLGLGSLVLGGKGVKKVAVKAKTAGQVSLLVESAAKAKPMLEELGKVKLALKVTFTPVGGNPNTESTKVTLKKLLAP